MNKESSGKENIQLIFGRSIFRVMLIACLTIIIAVVLVGTISYSITQKEVLNKLKTKDLTYIADSIAAKLEGRIDRAKETALNIARDPSLIDWVKNGEKDSLQGSFAKQRLMDIAKDYDYSNTFIVSTITHHYWAENGKIIETMDRNNPDHKWFFDTIQSKNPIKVTVDYNDGRNDTFVFVNALMGPVDQPLAVVGVGLSLKNMAAEFAELKYGENSTIRVINDAGNVYLSDHLAERGKNISLFVPNEVKQAILHQTSRQEPFITSYENKSKQAVDLISYPIESAGWRLVVEVPRSDSVSFLDTIKLNTIIATILLLLFTIFLFYFITKYLANPYKRALEVNQELEKEVWQQTEELQQKNQTLLDSIDYAKRIQQSVLPTKSEVSSILKDYFLLWKPRDVVGGDFYWAKSFGTNYLLAIGDCTGHGVPGACMTMLAISTLNHVVKNNDKHDPALILQELNHLLKEMLHQEQSTSLTDDGLDIGLCFVDREKNTLLFAGAKTDLYIHTNHRLEIIRGDRKSIGYRRTETDFAFTNKEVDLQKGKIFVMTTDGFPDQNGGEKNYSFGKKRFAEILHQLTEDSLQFQSQRFEDHLTAYMGDELQRDDITVIAFRP